MALTIWKYELRVFDLQHVTMPKGARILSFQAQNDTPCVWAMVDPDMPRESRTFHMHGTGHDVTNSKNMVYVGTAQFRGGSLVFHLFVDPA